MNSINKKPSKKLSKSEDLFVNFMALGTLAWFPPVGGSMFVSDSMDFVIIALVYLGISIPLYLYIRKRIMLFKPINTLLIIRVVSILAIIMLNTSLIFLYSYRIIVSKESLYINVLFSLFVVFGCVEAWVKG